MELLELALSRNLASAILVVIYLIIAKFIDNINKKDEIKVSKSLGDSVITIGEYIKEINKNLINKDKTKYVNAVNSAFYASMGKIIIYVDQTIIANSIELNKDNINSNIKTLVDTEYYNIYNILSLYSINEQLGSEYIKERWKEEIIQNIKETMFNDKIDKERKIIIFHDKIKILFDSYISYILNNTL